MNPKPDEKPRSFKDLVVWQAGMKLTRAVYLLTQKFPSDERFGLISQMRRCAVSIPNIAEGQARHTTGEFVQFISYAEGSTAELYTQLNLSFDLGFCTDQEASECLIMVENLRKMLNGLRRKLLASH